MRERRRRSHTQVLLAVCWLFKVNYKVLLLSHNLVRSVCFSPLIKNGLEVTDQRGRFKEQEDNQDGKTEQGKKTLLIHSDVLLEEADYIVYFSTDWEWIWKGQKGFL